MPQTTNDLRRAVAFGLAHGKTNMVADLAPLSELLVAHDALLAALREVGPLLERLGSSGGLAAVRAALALADPR
jgi:hypothetical protein